MWNRKPNFRHYIYIYIYYIPCFLILYSLCCVKVLSTPGEIYQPSYISKIKCLTLESELRWSELPGIVTLLWRLPDLEVLIINLIPSVFVSVSTIALCNNNVNNITISLFKFSKFLLFVVCII